MCRQRKQQTSGSSSERTRVWTDASVLNNGKLGQSCAYAAVLDDGSIAGHLLAEIGIGDKTVNDGEYRGVLFALEWALEQELRITVITDSQLVERQVSGVYDTKKAHLVEYRDRVRELLKETQSRLMWRPREENKAGWHWERRLKERAKARKLASA